MDIITLNARLRTGTGRSHSRKLRQEGWIPAVYYGHNRETKHIEINKKEFAAIVRTNKTMHLINLTLPDEKDATSVIKEIQRHVLRNDLFYHIDFQHVAMDEKITVHCPLHVVGTAIGVKDEGGILSHPKRTLTVECLPGDIPERVDVDVSELHMGQSVHVKDLTIPNVAVQDSPEDVIAVVVHPQVTVEEAPAEEAVEGEEGAEGAEGVEEAAEAEGKDIKEGAGAQKSDKEQAEGGKK